ncbi:MAG: hypothetical protein HC897_12840 [Thermoanaerobaculia bacterium]|nr:hypothetical protein [Thermoanaerobaculia bacterium]
MRAIEVDLEIDELPEETEAMPHEEDPGALLVVNVDDDNGNETPDLEDTGEVEDEDDLVELKINFDDQVETGELRLEAMSGGESVKVWEEETKATPLELPKTWKLEDGDEIPTSVWVEGVEGSSPKGVELRLLYTNDAGAEVEDKVVATALAIDFVLSPGDRSLVEADAGATDLGFSVFLPDFKDPQAIRPAADGTEVEWELLEGGASLGDSSSTTEEGFGGTALAIPPTPGDVSRVAATLKSLRLDQPPFDGEEIELSLRKTTGPIETIPGLPATITLEPSSTSFSADEVATITITAQILDGVGNPVADGTEVSWITGQGSLLAGAQKHTAGGVATATIRASDVPGSEEIEVRAGALVETILIDVAALDAVLTVSPASLDVELGETAQVTLAANAADGAEVFWMTSNGTLSGGTRMFGGSPPQRFRLPTVAREGRSSPPRWVLPSASCAPNSPPRRRWRSGPIRRC